MRYRGIRIRGRDWFWGGVAAAVLIAVLWAFVGYVLSQPWQADHAGIFGLHGTVGMLVEIVIGVTVSAWLVLGAWRRTVWGAPPSGQRDHVEMRHLDRERRG